VNCLACIVGERTLRGRIETGLFGDRVSSVLLGHERTEALSQ
jgi:hypothetical protein